MKILYLNNVLTAKVVSIVMLALTQATTVYAQNLGDTHLSNEIYSDRVTGSIELTSSVSLEFGADVNCQETFLGSTTIKSEDVSIKFKKDSYQTLLDDAEKEAEIASMETGFIYPSYHDSKVITAVGKSQSDTASANPLQNSLLSLISNLVYYQSGYRHCLVDNLNVQVIKKIDLRS